MLGTELEQLLRKICREELAKLIGVEPEQVDEAAEDDLRQLVAERAARLRAKAGAR